MFVAVFVFARLQPIPPQQDRQWLCIDLGRCRRCCIARARAHDKSANTTGVDISSEEEIGVVWKSSCIFLHSCFLRCHGNNAFKSRTLFHVCFRFPNASRHAGDICWIADDCGVAKATSLAALDGHGVDNSWCSARWRIEHHA